MYEKINTYIASGTYILIVCVRVAKQFRRLMQEHERKECNVAANVVGRHTLPDKKEKVMYISKREEKRRLQKMWHKSAEEQMQEYYLQQENRAATIGTQIERNAFEISKVTRMRKRVHNTLYKEQAGTCGTYMHTMRFENSYITKVCRVSANRY